MTIFRMVGFLVAAQAATLAFAQGSASFSLLEPLQSNDAVENIDDRRPELVASGHGTWLAVWEAGDQNAPDPNRDVLVARSANNGATWSAPMRIGGTFSGDDDTAPTVATDGRGVWIIAYESTSSAGFDIGSDIDILYVRSTDDGVTFGDPQIMNSTAASDGFPTPDLDPSIAADGRGNWVCAWASEFDGLDSLADEDIWHAFSADNGETWSSAALVNSYATSDLNFDARPKVHTDRAGRWVIAWTGDEGLGINFGFDLDLFYGTATILGQGWGTAQPLNIIADIDGGGDDHVDFAADGNGNWYAVWSSNHDYDNDGTKEFDIYLSHSIDGGTTWEDPLRVQKAEDDNGGGNEDFFDSYPRVATDKRGNITVVWDRSVLVDGLPVALQSLFAVSSDHGQTWTIPAQIDGPGQASAFEATPAVATDLNGRWLAVVSTNNDFNGATSGDVSIGVSEGSVTGSISGRLYDALTEAPIDCAAILLTEQAPGDSERLTTTDRQGRFSVQGLTAGTYVVRVNAVGYPVFEAIVDVLNGRTTFFTRGLGMAGGAVDVAGFVSDADTGAAIAGAKITASIGQQILGITYTCAGGLYEFRGLLEGVKGTQNITLTFESRGYDTVSRVVAIDQAAKGTGGDQAMEKNIIPVVSLGGTVVSAASEMGLSGAQVTVEGPINNSTTTDQQGAYLIDALPQGSYTVRASEVSHLSQTAFVTIAAGIEEVSFVLPAGELPPPLAEDVNDDGQVNAVDVQLVINSLLGVAPSSNGDVNNDESTDSVDLQLVINAALGLSK